MTDAATPSKFHQTNWMSLSGRMLLACGCIIMLVSTQTASSGLFRKELSEADYIAQLSSESERLAVRSLAVLGDRYRTSTPALLAIRKCLITDPRPEVQIKAMRVLGVMGADLSAEELAVYYRYLESPQPEWVIQSLKGLRGLQKPEGAVTRILPILSRADQNDPHVTRDACRTLAVLGDQSIIVEIQPLLAHRDEDVRLDARVAIDKLQEVIVGPGDSGALSTTPTSETGPESTSLTQNPTRYLPPDSSISRSRTGFNETLWQPGGRKKIWVLIVGITHYSNQTVPDLVFAKSDATRVQKWMEQFVDRDGIRVLLDEQATRVNLMRQINWLRKEALPEDAVFVYFAVHGAPELAPDGRSVDAKYLLLHDSDPTQLFATGFALDDLTSKLDLVKAQTQVVILEACYTGPIGQSILNRTPTADLQIRPKLIQEMGQQTGRTILSASSGRQIAIGVDEIGGGLFTHYLLRAWGDGRNRLLAERFDDASDEVRRAANRLGSTQEPVKFGDRNLDVILNLGEPH